MGLLFYLLAKILELLDEHIFRFAHVLSGHSLKHLCAAMTCYFVLLMLKLRTGLLPPHRASNILEPSSNAASGSS
jgi:hypothetical protein